MRLNRGIASAAVALALTTGSSMSVGQAGATTALKPNAKTKILAISDMPSGWSVNNSVSSSTETPACLAGIRGIPKGGTRATVNFAQGGSIPTFTEVLVTGPSQRARFNAVLQGLSTCKSFTVSSQGQSYTGSIGKMSFPKVADKSVAYTVTLNIKGINAGIDLVAFKSGPYNGAIEYVDVGTPDVTQLQQLVNLAVTKIKSGSTSAANEKGGAHVGGTQSVSDSSGAKANVTLTQVIDPATPGNQYLTPDSGKRFVATVLTITNTGGSALQGDADGDATLIGSDNQSYTPDFSSVSECTNFSNGSYQLNVGESATGCVTFQLPIGVAPAKFQYSAAGGFGGSFAEWQIP